MLLNNFYYLDSLQVTDTVVKADIRIETDHPILKGHFPQQAVVPGVCMMDMLQEILTKAFNQAFELKSASVIKFLTLFAPPQFTQASWDIQCVASADHLYSVSATLQQDAQVFMKFKGIYSVRA